MFCLQSLRNAPRLARFVLGLMPSTYQTSASQWMERTLDDSVNRRLSIPQAFLAADAILRIAQNLAGGLVANPAVIRREVDRYLPYMATENLLMAAVAAGGDRQEVHEVIRRHSAREYQVFALGFAPGFAFMGLVEEALAAPRLDTPRKRVAAAKDSWSAVAGGELHRMPALPEQFSLVGESLQRMLPRRG